MERPQISVCIATHNGEEYISNQLRSILNQLDKMDEIVISDDGSSDNTLSLISDFKDNRIKLFNYSQSQKVKNKRLGSYYLASANFFNALNHANGDIIFLSDQDDIWYSNKVDVCLEALKNYDFISHNFSIIDQNGDLQIYKYLVDYDVTPWKLRLLLKTPYRGCCVAMKRRVLEAAFPPPKVVFLHDFWICCNAILRGYRFHYIDQPLIKYRRHGANVSDMVSQNLLVFKIQYRVKLFFQILLHNIKRFIKRMEVKMTSPVHHK